MTRRSRIEGLLATGPQADETMTRLIAPPALVRACICRFGW